MSFRLAINTFLSRFGLNQDIEEESKIKFKINSEKKYFNVLNYPEQIPMHFNVNTISHPKICPVCRTKNKISILENNEWHCDECDYSWISE